jgi:hypothetical protein
VVSAGDRVPSSPRSTRRATGELDVATRGLEDAVRRCACERHGSATAGEVLDPRPDPTDRKDATLRGERHSIGLREKGGGDTRMRHRRRRR